MSDNPKNRPPKHTPIEAKRRATAKDGEARQTPERLKTKGSKLTPSSRASCTARRTRGCSTPS